MGYRYRKAGKSQINSVEVVEGEPIELKIERIVSNKEPISDGAPAIYTERKEGVKAAYNIRTDRWEIATEAMDVVSKTTQARRDHKAKLKEEKEADKEEKGKVVELKADKKVSEAKSTEGTAGAK
jgi:hypothetical protein